MGCRIRHVGLHSSAFSMHLGEQSLGSREEGRKINAEIIEANLEVDWIPVLEPPL
jgi:hypothetical protein